MVDQINIPSEVLNSLNATTTLMRVEIAYLRSKGEQARARGIEVQLEVNEQILKKYSG